MPLAPVTDPDILQQLNASSTPAAAPPGLQPVDPTTAKFLDQLSSQQQPPDLATSLKSILGNPQAQRQVMAANNAGNNVGSSFLMGLRDPIDAGASMLAHGLSDVFPNSAWVKHQAQDVAASNRAAEQSYAQSHQGQTGTDWGRLAGQMVTTLPLGFAMPGASAPGIGARLASGAATGAAAGALQPTTNAQAPDYWHQVGQNALSGAAGGAAGAGLTAALARVISPVSNPDVQTLIRSGVTPTPGQVIGGTANRTEQGLTSVPVMGDFIKNARRAATVQFNAGAINQALAPIGEKLEAQPGTRAAIEEMQTKIGNAYDQLAPQLGWPTGSAAVGTMMAGLRNLATGASASLPPDAYGKFSDAVNRLIGQRLSAGGGITGSSFKEAMSDLGKMATGLASNPNGDFWDKRLSGALYQAQDVLRQAQTAANPQAASQLAKVDNAFAQSLRINNAATRASGEPGLFTPGALQQATKTLDSSMRKNAFAAGDALMQNYAEAGKGVLGNTVPDSGTPYRHALQYGLGALGLHAGGEAAGIPASVMTPIAMGAGIGTLGAGALYSPLGRALAAKLLTSRPVAAPALSAALRGVSPVGSTIGAGLGSGP